MSNPTPARDKLSAAEDEILQLFAGANTVKDVCKRYDVARDTLWKWINADHDRLARYKAALKESGSAWAEKAAEALEEAKGESSAEVQLAKARADFYWRMAERRDRDQYGEEKNRVDLNVNIGDLHLNALRIHGHMDKHQEIQQPSVKLLPPSSEDAA